MKKLIFSFIAFVCGINMMLNAQILNPGFENWTAGNPDYWATSNAFPAGLVNVTQTTDKHTGTYALQGDVVSFFGTPIGPVIQSGPDATGFPISEKYHALELYYKFTSVGGDKFSVNVGFEKEGSPIAQGAVALPVNVGSYTFLSVPMDYFVDDVPDLAIIQISITGPVTGNDYHIGSVMFIDDLAFSLGTGLAEPQRLSPFGICYPNPTSDFINIPMSDCIRGDIFIKVFDHLGKEVKSMTFGSIYPGTGNLQFSIDDLPSGIYFYSIERQNKYYSEKFTVSSR